MLQRDHLKTNSRNFDRMLSLAKVELERYKKVSPTVNMIHTKYFLVVWQEPITEALNINRNSGNF